MFYTQGKIIVRKHCQTPGRNLGVQNQQELCKLLNDCKGLARLASRGSKAGPKKEFFGDYGITKNSEIDDRFQKIWLFLDGLDKFTFVSSNDDVNSVASFPMKDIHKAEGGMPLGDLTRKYKNSVFIRIGPRYFDANLSYKEKILTIMHELTHMTIGTKDVRFPVTNIEVYGEFMCKELAETAPDMAYKNAENWAYYSIKYWDIWRS